LLPLNEMFAIITGISESIADDFRDTVMCHVRFNLSEPFYRAFRVSIRQGDESFYRKKSKGGSAHSFRGQLEQKVSLYSKREYNPLSVRARKTG